MIDPAGGTDLSSGKQALFTVSFDRVGNHEHDQLVGERQRQLSQLRLDRDRARAGQPGSCSRRARHPPPPSP